MNCDAFFEVISSFLSSRSGYNPSYFYKLSLGTRPLANIGFLADGLTWGRPRATAELFIPPRAMLKEFKSLYNKRAIDSLNGGHGVTASIDGEDTLIIKVDFNLYSGTLRWKPGDQWYISTESYHITAHTVLTPIVSQVFESECPAQSMPRRPAEPTEDDEAIVADWLASTTTIDCLKKYLPERDPKKLGQELEMKIRAMSEEETFITQLQIDKPTPVPVGQEWYFNILDDRINTLQTGMERLRRQKSQYLQRVLNRNVGKRVASYLEEPKNPSARYSRSKIIKFKYWDAQKKAHEKTMQRLHDYMNTQFPPQDLHPLPYHGSESMLFYGMTRTISQK